MSEASCSSIKIQISSWVCRIVRPRFSLAMISAEGIHADDSWGAGDAVEGYWCGFFAGVGRA